VTWPSGRNLRDGGLVSSARRGPALPLLGEIWETILRIDCWGTDDAFEKEVLAALRDCATSSRRTGDRTPSN
jgi:hypothetical protein